MNRNIYPIARKSKPIDNQMNKLPRAKSADIVVQELHAEILVYDLRSHRAFKLNETSTLVYQACDGRTTFDELKRKYGFTDDLIFLALDELKKEDLLENDDSYSSPLALMSRRESIKKVGMASLIALPVVLPLVIPKAADAASGGGTLGTGAACTANGQCISGTCRNVCSGGVDSCSTLGGACTNSGVCVGPATCSTGGPCDLPLVPCNGTAGPGVCRGICSSGGARCTRAGAAPCTSPGTCGLCA